MSLMQLFEQHERDLKAFEALRNQKWAEMNERHTQTAAAFGGVEKLPGEYQKKHAAEKQQFIKEWSNNTGTKHKAMTQEYEKKLKAIKDQDKKLDRQKPKMPTKPTAAQAPANNNQANKAKQDRDTKKQQLIKESQAITAKAQKRKRSR